MDMNAPIPSDSDEEKSSSIEEAPESIARRDAVAELRKKENDRIDKLYDAAMSAGHYAQALGAIEMSVSLNNLHGSRR